ncbi:hypothetical protein PG989_004520 [Apiospora arundinis]
MADSFSHMPDGASNSYMPDRPLEMYGVVLFDRSHQRVCLLGHFTTATIPRTNFDSARPGTGRQFRHQTNEGILPQGPRYYDEHYRDAARRIV